MARPHPFALIHPIVTSALTVAYAGLALLELGGPPSELEQGYTINRWFLAAVFAAGAAGLVLAAGSSWLLLGAEGQQIVDGPLRLALMAKWWMLGMLVAGPMVALIEVMRTGHWYPVVLGITGGICAFLPAAAMLRWQFRRIKARRTVQTLCNK